MAPLRELAIQQFLARGKFYHPKVMLLIEQDVGAESREMVLGPVTRE